MQSLVWCALGVVCMAVPVLAGELTTHEQDRVEAWLDLIHHRGLDPLQAAPGPAAPTEVQGRPRLALARSILTFQAQLDTLGAITRGDAVPLLVLARHYANLGLARESVRWYRHAYVADTTSRHRVEILSELAEAAVASADSATILNQAWFLARRADLTHVSDSLAELLAAGAHIGGGLAVTRELVDKLVPRASDLSASCVAELAWQRQGSGQVESARELWRQIVGREEVEDLATVGRALRGLADCSFLLGDHETAAHLYRLFRIHDAGLLSAWSTYQLAGLAAANGDYDEAIAGFRSLCERDDSTPWKEESCWRLTQARQLVDIQDALRPFRRGLHAR